MARAGLPRCGCGRIEEAEPRGRRQRCASAVPQVGGVGEASFLLLFLGQGIGGCLGGVGLGRAGTADVLPGKSYAHIARASRCGALRRATPSRQRGSKIACAERGGRA
eukprot:365053-Chlamydomonas_euryale.AAC.4